MITTIFLSIRKHYFFIVTTVVNYWRFTIPRKININMTFFPIRKQKYLYFKKYNFIQLNHKVFFHMLWVVCKIYKGRYSLAYSILFIQFRGVDGRVAISSVLQQCVPLSVVTRNFQRGIFISWFYFLFKYRFYNVK